MDLTRRFVFRGNACALSGRMYRPTDQVLSSPAAASITVAGGLSEAQARQVRFRPYLSTGACEARAEGRFAETARALAWTHGRVEEDSLSPVTAAACSVSDVVVGRKRLTVKRLRAELAAQGPANRTEPAIRVGRETVIEGVAIDGYGLDVTIARAAFERYDTRSKLLAAAASPAFAAAHGHCFLMTSGIAGRPEPGRPRLIAEGGTVYATIVSSLKWKKRPHPEAQIAGHTVVVPEFGRIYFGEIFITDVSRRLTLVRLQLGSPEGGSLALSEVETNGSWYPPTS
jgi:hypothetical protein